GGSPRIVDAGAGAQPAAKLPRYSAALGRIRTAHELHPRGVFADHGASVLRFLGLSDDGLFCPDVALRRAAGFHVPGGLPASARYWRDPGLGAVALPF